MVLIIDGEPGRVDRVKDAIPMGRGGQPEEVAQARDERIHCVDDAPTARERPERHAEEQEGD